MQFFRKKVKKLTKLTLFNSWGGVVYHIFLNFVTEIVWDMLYNIIF